MGRPKKITPTVEKAPSRLPGTFDVLPEQQAAFNFFMDKFINLAHTFGYQRIDTPFIEDARLFKFWEQSTRDELITINEGKDQSLAVKPTNLLGLVRAYLEYRYFEREKVSKWYFASPVMYQRDGQIKQSDEMGFQIFGETAPIADAQIINLVMKLFGDVGLTNLSLEINNIGCL